MKKFITIIVLLILTSPVGAGNKKERVYKDKGINDLLQMGYEIIIINDSNTFSTYHLKKGKELVTCNVDYASLPKKTKCYKP